VTAAGPHATGESSSRDWFAAGAQRLSCSGMCCGYRSPVCRAAEHMPSDPGHAHPEQRRQQAQLLVVGGQRGACRLRHGPHIQPQRAAGQHRGPPRLPRLLLLLQQQVEGCQRYASCAVSIAQAGRQVGCAGRTVSKPVCQNPCVKTSSRHLVHGQTTAHGTSRLGAHATTSVQVLLHVAAAADSPAQRQWQTG
jgi:hypothetical protein